MQNIKGLALAGLALAWAGPAAAASFDDIFYFGDSLTDCCVQGRYTEDVNGEDTPTWADLLPGLIDADYTPTVTNNRAVGGAQSGETNLSDATDQEVGYDTGYLNQVRRFVDDGVEVTPDDIAAIWIGTNDIWPSAQSTEFLNQPLGPAPDTDALAAYVAGNVREGAESLFDAGFRNFLFLSPYDLADCNCVFSEPAEAVRERLTDYSLATRDALAGLEIDGAETFFFDTAEFLDSVQANAGEFGFEYLTGREPLNGTTCEGGCDPSDFIFVDAIHLTSAFNEDLARAVAAEIDPIPLPGGALLYVGGLALVGGWRLRRRA